ncbi:MAG: PepSY1/2 domain-containing protein [Clostridia bacterium]
MQNTKRTQTITMVIAIIMTAATIALSIAFGITLAQKIDKETKLNNLYEKSYYETIDALNNSQNDLKKVGVVDSEALRRDLLLDIWNNCSLASDNLSQLSTQSEHLPDIIKMLNQIGDYARYLSKKSAESGFSDEEIENINSFSAIIEKITTSLIAIEEKLIVGDKISAEIISDSASITDNLDTIDYSSIDYPELIYDGPFSDGLSDRVPKNLENEEELSQQRAQELITTYFEDATEIEFVSDNNVSLAAYMFKFKIDNTESYISLSKKGGKVIQYNTYREINNPLLDDDECIAKATEYIEQMGYTDMKPVWISNNNSTVYVNFAYEKDEILYYPDLVKIKISGEDGTLLGVEAQTYLYNHIERVLPYSTSLDNISINANLEVKSKVVCIIPTTWDTEILCLEVVASHNGSIYYVYYNMETGEEERILLVVDEEGQLLM